MKTLLASIERLEADRRCLQARLDAQRTPAERNRLGQFATPPALAVDMLRHAVSLLPAEEPIRFLDPAIGTGVFYSALRTLTPESRITEALGLELDPRHGEPAGALWRGSGLSYRIADFTRVAGEPRFNLVICNPPYVRHHHLDPGEKARLRHRTLMASGMQLGGLSGLYCHFLGLAHAWMADGGVAGWLIPSEFMDVSYGRALKSYLLSGVTLLHIHRFDPGDVQFADALVSSAVVWLRKAPPPLDHAVRFTFGGPLDEPTVSRHVPARALVEETKWTRFPVAAARQKSSMPTVGDFFSIRRGLATGDNGYFILRPDEVRRRALPLEVMRPILPGPRHLPGDRVDSDEQGWPRLDRQLLLLDTRLPEGEIQDRYPTLFAYLEEGRQRALQDRYLCRHRAPWYAQESRPPAPLLCTYLGRGSAARQRPFRFILNLSQATAANVYLMMYPTPVLAAALRRDPALLQGAWQVLKELTATELEGEGRVYGGGLHKLEPRELAQVPVPRMMDLLAGGDRPASQGDLLAGMAVQGMRRADGRTP